MPIEKFVQGPRELRGAVVEIGPGLIATQNDSGKTYIDVNAGEGGTATGHNHNDLYYTESEADARFRLAEDDIPYGEIDGAPATMTPTAHGASHGDGGSDEIALDASQVTTGAFLAARIPSLDASKVGSGTLDDGRIPAGVARYAGTSAFTGSVFGSSTPGAYMGRVSGVTGSIRVVAGGGYGWFIYVSDGDGALYFANDDETILLRLGLDGSLGGITSLTDVEIDAAQIVTGVLTKAIQHGMTAYTDFANIFTAAQVYARIAATNNAFIMRYGVDPLGAPLGSLYDSFHIRADGRFRYFSTPGVVGNAVDVEHGRVSAGVYGIITGTAFQAPSYRVGTTEVLTSARVLTNFFKPRSTKTAAYTVTDTDNILDVDTAGGAVVITLPTAVGRNGREYRVTKVDAAANNVTVATTGGQTINGAANKVLGAQWASALFYSNGANWVAV